MMQLEVSFDLPDFLGLAGLAVVLGLAQVVVVQFLQEGLVAGLGEHALFLKDGQDTHGLEATTQKLRLTIIWYIVIADS